MFRYQKQRSKYDDVSMYCYSDYNHQQFGELMVIVLVASIVSVFLVFNFPHIMVNEEFRWKQ